MRVFLLVAVSAALSACADTRGYISGEVLHASHLSQHFESPPTNYGYDAVAVSIRIERPGSGPFAELAEGYILEPRWSEGGISGAGAMIGPSELTQVTVGYRWRVW